MKKIGKINYGNVVPKPGTADNQKFVDVDAKSCIGCKHCADICPTGAISSKDPSDRWSASMIKNAESCIFCGQCLVNCPVNAIYENVSFIDVVKKALADPDILTVAMPAPAVRYALGEEFGLPEGSYVGGKMFTALRKLGFDVIWDVEFGADLTILEEGGELIGRATGKLEGRPFPQLTSCCPGWVRYVETFYPELIPNLSTAKSPTQMNGVLAKTYGAKFMNAEPKKIFTVAIMPCIAKKFEGLRAEFQASGFRDVDATLTTREFAHLIQEAGLDLKSLTDGAADDLLGLSTGAATIFGVTGGVMEAMLRYLAEELSGKSLENIEFEQVRGTKGVKEAALDINGTSYKVAVVSGLANAKDICEQIKEGKCDYTAVEIMACPGGCVNGGGQPYADWNKRVGFVPSLLKIRNHINAMFSESDTV